MGGLVHLFTLAFLLALPKMSLTHDATFSPPKFSSLPLSSSFSQAFVLHLLCVCVCVRERDMELWFYKNVTKIHLKELVEFFFFFQSVCGVHTIALNKNLCLMRRQPYD
jgi:hypothetical protein